MTVGSSPSPAETQQQQQSSAVGFILLARSLRRLTGVTLDLWRHLALGRRRRQPRPPAGLSGPLAPPLALGQLGLQALAVDAEVLQGSERLLGRGRVAVVQEGPVLSALPGQPEGGGVALPEGALQFTDSQAGRNPPQVHRGHAGGELPRRRRCVAVALALYWAFLAGGAPPPPPPLLLSGLSLSGRPLLPPALLPRPGWPPSSFRLRLFRLVRFGFSLRLRSCVGPPSALPLGSAALRAGFWSSGRRTQSHILASQLLRITQLLQDGDLLQLLLVQLKVKQETQVTLQSKSRLSLLATGL